jgi:DNA-binding GntR family transcriptional regulator
MVFQTKQDHVAEILRERIIAGVYQRGDKLKQADIASELGVSITPVREALQLLEAEGFVIGLAHKGVLVPPFEPSNAKEIYELRVTLERELTLHALKAMTREKLAELKRVQSLLALAIKARDLNEIRTENYRFHFKLYELAERPQTLQFVRVLWAKYPFTDQDKDISRNERMRGEHEHFLSKVGEGDIQGAVAAMVSHIESGWRQLVAVQAQQAPQSGRVRRPARVVEDKALPKRKSK